MEQIDLNCDMGEGHGNELEILPLISSCNISCGLHAGTEIEIRKVIDLAVENDVAIGAHPSFDDRENFGRNEMNLSAEELQNLIRTQLLKFQDWVNSAGAKISHVKPHGALYSMAAKSSEISETLIQCLSQFDSKVKFMGLAQSEMEYKAKGKTSFIAEGFADRRYDKVNQLRSRNDAGLITTPNEIKEHVLDLVEGRVKITNGVDRVSIQSICVHGDSPRAAEHIRMINEFLIERKISIKPVA